MAPAAVTGAEAPELARFDARTVQADIESLTSHDEGTARFGTVSLLRKLQTGATDCVDVLSKPRGADALVAALQAGGRFVGLLLSDYLVMLSVRSMLGDDDTVQPGLRKLRRAGVVPALCSLLVAEAAPANGEPADGSASGNFRVTQALLLVTQFVGRVTPESDEAEAAANAQAVAAGAIPHLIAQVKHLEPAAAQPALVVLHNIARVVRPLPADMRAAVQPLLQLLRRQWQAAPASSGAAARALAYSAAADPEIAAVLRRADAVAVATPMLAASVPPHLATGAAALVEDVVRTDPAAGLTAALKAGTVKGLVRWLRVPAAADVDADRAASGAALALAALGPKLDEAACGRYQRALHEAGAVAAVLQLLRRRRSNSSLGAKAATVLAKAVGEDRTAQDEAVAGGAFALLRPLLATPHADFMIPAAVMFCVAELCYHNQKAAHAAIAADLLQHFEVLLRQPGLQQPTFCALTYICDDNEPAARAVAQHSQLVKLLTALLLPPLRPTCSAEDLATAGEAIKVLQYLAAADPTAECVAGAVRPAARLLSYEGEDGGKELQPRAVPLLAYLIRPQDNTGRTAAARTAAAARNAEVAVAAGAIQPLCRMLLQPGWDHRTHWNAVCILRQVAGPPHSGAVVAAGGLLGLVRFLQRPQLPPQVAEAVIYAIGSVCRGQPAHQAALYGIGGGGALIDQLQRPNDSDAQRLVAKAASTVLGQLSNESEALATALFGDEDDGEIDIESIRRALQAKYGSEDGNARHAAFQQRAAEIVRRLEGRLDGS